MWISEKAFPVFNSSFLMMSLKLYTMKIGRLVVWIFGLIGIEA